MICSRACGKMEFLLAQKFSKSSMYTVTGGIVKTQIAGPICVSDSTEEVAPEIMRFQVPTWCCCHCWSHEVDHPNCWMFEDRESKGPFSFATHMGLFIHKGLGQEHSFYKLKNRLRQVSWNCHSILVSLFTICECECVYAYVLEREGDRERKKGRSIGEIEYVQRE